VTGMLISSGGSGRDDDQTGMAHAGWRTCCPLCGGHDGHMFCRTRDFNWAVPGEFTYVTCTGCGLLRQNPAPPEETLRNMYPTFYGTSQACNGDPDKRINTPPFEFRANILEGFKQPPASLLDIGCGSGFFLAFMRRRGWDVNGIESAGEHVEYANRVLGLAGVRHAVWPSEAFAGMQVDVISFIHVLEHFLDPVEALERTRDIMKPGALLIIETPNAEGWPLSIFGRYCVQMDAPRHICLFSPAALQSCARKAGYKTAFLRTYAPSTMEWTESLRYVLATAGLRSYGRKSAVGESRGENGRTVKSSAAGIFLQGLHATERALCRGLNRISAWAGQGANILMIARKT
jgi:SAM-dependent methyltransferase